MCYINIYLSDGVVVLFFTSGPLYPPLPPSLPPSHRSFYLISFFDYLHMALLFFYLTSSSSLCVLYGVLSISTFTCISLTT